MGAISTQLSSQLPPARLVSKVRARVRLRPLQVGVAAFIPFQVAGTERFRRRSPLPHSPGLRKTEGTPRWGRCRSRGEAQASGRRGGSLRLGRAPRPAPARLRTWGNAGAGGGDPGASRRERSTLKGLQQGHRRALLFQQAVSLATGVQNQHFGGAAEQTARPPPFLSLRMKTLHANKKRLPGLLLPGVGRWLHPASSSGLALQGSRQPFPRGPSCPSVQGTPF